MYVRSLLVASVAFSGCLFALSSIADEQNLSLEEIVVTARKQEESAQDVPVAITALTAELENSTIRSLRDLDGYAPNLSFGVDGNRGGGGANVTIRGLSPTRSDDNSFDSPVAIVIDDIYLGSMAGAVIESFDLERVEVLRGPQGTLFGKNTVAGVINVIRSKPTGETGGKVKITAGKDGQQEIRGVFNFGLSDTLAMKVFATDIQFDGHMDNITTGRGVAEKSYQNFGAKFLFEPNDRFTADLTIERFQDDGTLDSNQTNYNTAPGVLPQPPAGSPENDYSGGFATCTIGALLFGVDGCRPGIETPGVSVNDKDNVYDIETDALTLKMTYELNDNISLVSITGYRDMLEYRLYDFDASAVPFITIERDNDYEQFSQELRLDGQWDNVTLSAGLYYFNNDFEQDWVTGDGFWGFVFGTFGIGPAGTGKTYLAMAMAASALHRGEVSRIILTRPAVEAGERLGFLPGDLQQKVDPYLRPLYDALHSLLSPERTAALIEKNIIEVAPLAYMRGRTLADAFVILDEAQNTTPAQMRMVLTRLGENSRMVVTGDPSQVDLPGSQLSGLVEAAQVLDGVEGIAICRLTAADVVRHPLVQRLVQAYARRDAQNQGRR